MSRQQYDHNSSAEPTPKSSTSRRSWEAQRLSQALYGSEQASSSPRSPPAVPSSSSEGYPSWLPRRPPPPAPRSTVHSASVAGMFSESGPSAGVPDPFVGGRKPTPRSVRIVSLHNSMQGDKDPYTRREPTDQSRISAAAHARVWSRATSAGLTPTVFSTTPLQTNVPKARFRSTSFHPELLRHPSWKMRLCFYSFPIFVLAHLPLQTFFDFNAVFILLLVAKFPNPAAPGVPGTGRNWALGAAAYIACWFTQIFVVFLLYELVYSFIRRWRVKRPLILPLYLSSPGFNFVSMTSYTNFCFMYFIRSSAFAPFASTSSSVSQHEEPPHSGSLRDGLAETFYFYSQNLPTVALLAPRATLSLALLLAFSSPLPFPQGDTGIFSKRDGTFFRAEDGTLTSYARGVLIANAAWTAWRILVLLVSWIGLWVLSGQGCAGLCGPRYRWEEEDMADHTAGPYSFADNASGHLDAPLPWTWREITVVRVYEAWDFCLTNKMPLRSGRELSEKTDDGERGMAFEGMDKVFAAVGLGGSPHPARRGVLSGELFETPQHDEKEEADIVPTEKTQASVTPPPAAQTREKRTGSAGTSGPLMKLPYPFTGHGAQVSSEDVVPFPPSPVPADEHSGETADEEVEEGEAEVEGTESGDDVPSSGRRTSESMSSLGRPITSRYPFQHRRPGRGGSMSSASQLAPPTNVSTPISHHTHSSNPSSSTQSDSTRNSRFTQSTGNRESSDSPMSAGSLSPIPMPPGHPRARRTRAGTVPAFGSPQTSPSPVAFPLGRPRARTRTESLATEASSTFGAGPIPLPAFDYSDEEDDGHYHRNDESLMDVPEAEGSVEEAEQHDSVGLLSVGPSPRTSLVNLHQFGSRMSLHRRATGSRSRSTHSRSMSRSRTNSATSRSDSARSRAQSLIQSLNAASRSSLDVVSPENYTFGHPMREQWRAAESSRPESRRDDISEAMAIPLPPSESSSSSDSSSDGGSDVQDTLHQGYQPALRPAPSDLSGHAPSEQQPERSGDTQRLRVPIPIPGPPRQGRPYSDSQPDISTANPSFVTAPATIEGRTDTSGRTPSSWGGIEHYAPGGTLPPA
ncbi:unnamed protein product [Somion occarium]|uniref:Proteophosphoglycan ppg4 n=1 Tax=Somion occarium TaxID=3059160 RepID=A0ABP1D787_9APHY